MAVVDGTLVLNLKFNIPCVFVLDGANAWIPEQQMNHRKTFGTSILHETNLMFFLNVLCKKECEIRRSSWKIDHTQKCVVSLRDV